MNITKTLKALCNEIGVSGEENDAAELALSYLKKYDENAYIKNGNVIGSVGSGKTHVLLDAHIDQIGLIVTFITDDGFIKVAGCGGVDRRLLAAQQVTIHGKSDIAGVITSVPPHLATDEKKLPEMSDTYIDTGMSKASLTEIVSLGDRITFFSTCEELLGTRVTGHAMDDRSGVAAILYALDKLKNDSLNCTVSVLFSTGEEVGERGAKIAAFDLSPDIAIAVDVSFAMAPDEKEDECGKLGGGVMIGIAPTLDRALSDRLIALAPEGKIPHQVEIMNGMTGTNADQFSVAGSGARASTLSIPLKYMHTPVEVIDTEDVKATGKLIAEFCRGVK